MSLSEMINITLSLPRYNNFSNNSSGFHQVPENDFYRSSFGNATEENSQFNNLDSETFYRNFYDCMKVDGMKTPATAEIRSHVNNRSNVSYQIQSNGELQKMTPVCTATLPELPEEYVKKTSPWRLIIQEEDIITSSPVYKKPKALENKEKDQVGFLNFLKNSGWKISEKLPGQEYLDDLYEIARSRNDPLLLESLESFLAATVEGLLQKQSDNEKLDTALKRATEKNSAIAFELEAEMEHQVAMLEEKIREEEQRKLEEQKQEAHNQLFSAQQELQDMEHKVKELEDHIEVKKNEAKIPDVIIEEIQNKEKENKLLQKKLVEFQTQMALMRTEVAQMKSVYDEQAERLATERGAVLSCVSEQENLTRQLHLLHEANKRLHDTNDDLRSALDHKRSQENSYADDAGAYPCMRSSSAILPRGRNSSLYNSFRSDPGARRQNGNVSNYDTDDDSKLSIPYDDDELPKLTTTNSVNETPLLAEIMAVDKAFPYESPIPLIGGNTHYSPANSTLMEPPSTNLDRENFIKQLEILCETNKRLGESNDELRDALGLLSGQIRMDQEIIQRTTTSNSGGGCRSAPITPMRNKCPEIERPQSTSSPRRILLTKSGYHSSLYETQSMPDISKEFAEGADSKVTFDEKLLDYISNSVETSVHHQSFHEKSPAGGDTNGANQSELTTKINTSLHSRSLTGSEGQSQSCSPSNSTLLSSITTGQSTSVTSQSSPTHGRINLPSSGRPVLQSNSNPGTNNVPPNPKTNPKSNQGSILDESRNHNERTCDCGNEIYGSDISICDYCLDSITSAVDELTTDYASSFSEDDAPTIYTDKEIDATLYSITGDAIFPIKDKNDANKLSAAVKSVKTMQCVENPFYESDVTDFHSKANKQNKFNGSESYCKCSDDDTLTGIKLHTSPTCKLSTRDKIDSIFDKSDMMSLKSAHAGGGGSNFNFSTASEKDVKDVSTDSTRTSSVLSNTTELTADEKKLILRIEMNESDIRNVASTEVSERSFDVSPLKVAIERVPVGSDRHSKNSEILDTVALKKSPQSIFESEKTTFKVDISDLIFDKKKKSSITDSSLVSDDKTSKERPSHLELTSEVSSYTPSESGTASTLVNDSNTKESDSRSVGRKDVTTDYSTSISSAFQLSKTPLSPDTSADVEVNIMPPNICPNCHQEIVIQEDGADLCSCNNFNDVDVNPISYRLLAESTLLTDSDDASNNYSDQEASLSDVRKRITPVGSNTQDATFENTDRANTDQSDWMSDGHSSHTTLLQNIEAELSMYSRRQPDEFVDEDDMDDEELVRLVDQTNEDDFTCSMTDDQIYIEEKVLEPAAEPRGLAVGADASEDSMSASDRGTPDRMYKLVLAGDAAVGKSSFIIRLCRNKFYSALNSTLGVDFQMKTLTVDGSKVALQLWDTAGQERFRSIAKSYFRRVDGVVLLYDVTCENSFMDVREWLDSIESSSSKDVPVIICGNKTDLRDVAAKNGMPVVSRQQGLRLAKEVGALFIETSAKDGTNIHKACVELTRKLQKIDDAQMAEVTINLEKEKPKPKSRCCR